MAAESDFDLAFRLQMEEALAASISLNSPPSPPPMDAHPHRYGHEAVRDHQRLFHDPPLRTATREDAAPPVHRTGVAILVPDQSTSVEMRERNARGQRGGSMGKVAKPSGEGSSRHDSDYVKHSGVVKCGDDDVYGLYFKGLVSEERIGGGMEKALVLGIGVAICDQMGNLVAEVKKPVTGSGLSRNNAEIRALIEGLSTALSLGIERIVFYCDYYPLFQFCTRRWVPRQKKIGMLMDQVFGIQLRFIYSEPVLLPCNKVKFVYKIAREALVSQISKLAEPTSAEALKETCKICLEDTDVERMFSVDKCLHRYCFSCMRQYVEVKLLQAMLPDCPHDECKSELIVDRCVRFLPSKLTELWNQRLKEASIPAMERVYCPYPKCSALMSKKEVSEYSRSVIGGNSLSEVRKCVKCHALFCMNCKVPWHSGMSCSDYKKANPNPSSEDLKLKSLAKQNLWRQCMKCQHMIELSKGCYHMKCRCGYEFCYKCGAEWKNSRATCSCPLWDDELLIIDDDVDDQYDDSEDEEDEDYDYDSDYYHEYYLL